MSKENLDCFLAWLDAHYQKHGSSRGLIHTLTPELAKDWFALTPDEVKVAAAHYAKLIERR